MEEATGSNAIAIATATAPLGLSLLQLLGIGIYPHYLSFSHCDVTANTYFHLELQVLNWKLIFLRFQIPIITHIMYCIAKIRTNHGSEGNWILFRISRPKSNWTPKMNIYIFFVVTITIPSILLVQRTKGKQAKEREREDMSSAKKTHKSKDDIPSWWCKKYCYYH